MLSATSRACKQVVTAACGHGHASAVASLTVTAPGRSWASWTGSPTRIEQMGGCSRVGAESTAANAIAATSVSDLVRLASTEASGGDSDKEASPSKGDSSSNPEAVGEAASSGAGGPASPEEFSPSAMKPHEVCESLDEYVIGQPDAKRAIAIALRNRWRRMRVADELRDEIIPKNILMIGPTGCGKTEIARRLAKLANAPFVKVEATKFTEVGFHGRDVDTIIRDLIEASATLVKELKQEQLKPQIEAAVENILVRAISGGANTKPETVESVRSLLRSGTLNQRMVEIELPVDETADGMIDVAMPGGQSMVFDASELMSRLGGGGKQRTQRRKLRVSEAWPLLRETELQSRLKGMNTKQETIKLAEEHGIVVIDEIDKIVPDSTKMRGGDASDEGVQRDLLPLIEGTTVDVRKYGKVKTDHMLFVCAGAFHMSKPADMLAELQGRLPIRVELKGLTAEDLYRILTEPKANLLEQQQALLGAEGVKLEFDDDAVRELANRAADINKSVENIGARRLYTVLERVMDEVSFDAADMEPGTEFRVTKALVEERLSDALAPKDLKKFIL